MQASPGEQGGAAQRNGKRVVPANNRGSGILSPRWEVEVKGRDDGTKKANGSLTSTGKIIRNQYR